MISRASTRWGILFRSDCRLDGYVEYIMFADRMPLLFLTRNEARAYVKDRCAWFTRPYLRAEPHGWLAPKVVRVAITVAE